MDKIKIYYGVALMAAPLFVFSYNLLFQHAPNYLNTLTSNNLESLFLLILFYPIIEEIIFRGIIQEYISAKSKKLMVFIPITMANILTSILFVAIHFIYYEVLWALLIFIPSLIFGYFKDNCQTLIPSISLHMFYNFCSLFLLIK